MFFWRTQPEFIYLYQHVPKCAGSSVLKALSRLGKASLILGFKCETKAEVWERANRELKIAPNYLRAIAGHRVYYGLHELSPASPRYFTFLRHPVKRVISLYNYMVDIALDTNHIYYERNRQIMLKDNGQPLSFREWIAPSDDSDHNHILRFLYHAMEGELIPGTKIDVASEYHLERAREFLHQCWFIGFTETFNDDVGFICSAIGVSPPVKKFNQSKKHFTLEQDPDVAEIILEKNLLDLQLYEYARQLRFPPVPDKIIATH
jgi:hypothetical protein